MCHGCGPLKMQSRESTGLISFVYELRKLRCRFCLRSTTCNQEGESGIQKEPYRYLILAFTFYSSGRRMWIHVHCAVSQYLIPPLFEPNVYV